MIKIYLRVWYCHCQREAGNCTPTLLPARLWQHSSSWGLLLWHCYQGGGVSWGRQRKESQFPSEERWPSSTTTRTGLDWTDLFLRSKALWQLSASPLFLLVLRNYFRWIKDCKFSSSVSTSTFLTLDWFDTHSKFLIKRQSWWYSFNRRWYMNWLRINPIYCVY